MEQLDRQIGLELKKEREKKGYSLREVANLLEISHTYVSKIEKGKIPSVQILKKLSQLYGIKLSSLFGDEVEVPEQLNELGVEWVSFATKMKKENLTPEEIERIVRVIREFKGL